MLICLPQVVLLESRDRLGGRVYTDYSFGFPVDMGASWYTYFVVILFSILTANFLSLRNFSTAGLNSSVVCFQSCFRLHGVCKENPLAPLIGRLGLPLYRTSGDNSVLYDHDLERLHSSLL